MAIELQQLVETQKQIEALFLRPVRLQTPHVVPPYLKKWYARFAALPTSEQPQTYLWGLKNFEGVAVSGPEYPRLDVWLAGRPPDGFPQFLRGLFPGVPLRLIATSGFRFLQGFGIGSNIALKQPTGVGMIGLFLNAGGNEYALTCAHVLDKKPASQIVDSGIARIGKLTFRIQISDAPLVDPTAPDPQAPNQVDCALTQLDAAGANNALPNGLGNVNGIAVVAQGANVTIANAHKTVAATVISTHADLGIPYHNGIVYFDDLIATTGEDSIQPGDSGSLVVDNGNHAAGLVMAICSDAQTIDNPSQDLGPIVIACDMQKILNNLSPLVGSTLSLA